MLEADPAPTPVDDAEQRGAGRSPKEAAPPPRDNQALEDAAFEVIGEAAPPPDAVEPDPELTPEQAEQVRKRYLLRRFWISARGYWGRRGDRLAWPCTIGLLILIGINV